MNLYEFLKGNNFEGLSMGLIRRFAIQILHSLKYMRHQGIIHCDLKPENILLKQANKSGIKVIDLGSSCFEDERVYTYIQSRFYRAPEIMLGIPYTTAIDMWSFGCILAELYTGYPLFPGESEKEQLAYIMEVVGTPPKYMLDIASRKKLFFDPSNNPILEENSRGRVRFPGSRTLAQKLKVTEKSFLNLLKTCLEWDPQKRLTPEEALRHEWILEGLPSNVLAHHQKVNTGVQKHPNLNMSTIKVHDRESKKRISLQIGQNASFNTTIERSPARIVENIVLKKPNNVASGQNAFFIRLGRKRGAQPAASNNLSIASQENEPPKEKRKQILKIRLANGIVNGLVKGPLKQRIHQGDFSGMLPPLGMEQPGPGFKQYKIVKLVPDQDVIFIVKTAEKV